VVVATLEVVILAVAAAAAREAEQTVVAR